MEERTVTTGLPDRIAVDAMGFAWRVWDDTEFWSMARINSDNSPIPGPVTWYVPVEEPTHSIMRWLIPEGERKLEVVIAAAPLGITERFCWQDYTNNHYGQGNKRTWWRWSMSGKPTIEVRGKAADLLTDLVHEHDVLSKLADYLLFPKRT